MIALTEWLPCAIARLKSYFRYHNRERPSESLTYSGIESPEAVSRLSHGAASIRWLRGAALFQLVSLTDGAPWDCQIKPPVFSIGFTPQFCRFVPAMGNTNMSLPQEWGEL
jgi:hypothetical protein